MFFYLLVYPIFLIIKLKNKFQQYNNYTKKHLTFPLKYRIFA